jgi:IS30 family transposase
MVKPLSEQLADLSVRAKHAEDAFSADQRPRKTLGFETPADRLRAVLQ